MTWIIMAVLALSPVVTWATMAVRERAVVTSAVADAVKDERLKAAGLAIAAQQAADARAAEAAYKARAEYLTKLDTARQEVADLEAELMRRPPSDGRRLVVFPRALVKEMNR